MNLPITYTSILLPRRRVEWLTRQRLVEFLYDLLEYKLILVTAPPGYGKTTLLIDFARKADLSVCWYSVDRHDDNLGQFLAHFIAAIRHHYPNFGSCSLSALENAIENQIDMEQIITVIVNEIYENIDEHFVLVLDDYVHVSDNVDIAIFISRFVHRVNENCHLMIASRKRPELPDTDLLISRSQVGIIDQRDLAFTPEEIQSLALRNYKLSISISQAEELARITEGWITGLLLSTQPSWTGVLDRLRVASASGVHIYDYLARQIFDQQLPSIQNFLLHTSLFDEFNGELCEVVLGPTLYSLETDFRELIDTVVRESLCLLPVGEQVTWYRYHNLFKNFLQSRLEKERPDEREIILRRLAIVHIEEADWEKAYDIFQHLNDQDAVIELIKTVGSQMMKEGRFRTLIGWLDDLSQEVFDAQPRLRSLRGTIALMDKDIGQALSLLNQAESDLRANGDKTGLARTLARRSMAYHFLGNYQASLADADELLSLIREDQDALDLKADALYSRGSNLLWLGNPERAIEQLTQSLAIYKRLSDKHNTANVYQDLGLAYRISGDYSSAKDCYNRSLTYWQNENNLHRVSQLFNNLGMLFYYSGEYELANLRFNEGLKYARTSGYTRMEAFILSGIGDLYAKLGAPRSAEAAYRQAHELSRQIKQRHLLLHLNLAEAALARSRGDLINARDRLASAQDFAEQDNSDYELGLCHLEAGRIAMAEARHPEAVSNLEKAIQLFQDAFRPIEEIQTHLYQAQAHHLLGEKDKTLEHLKAAFNQSSHQTRQHILAVTALEMTAFLKSAQNDPIFKDYVSQLLNFAEKFESKIPAMRRKIRAQPLAIPFEPPKFIIQALGEAKVVVDGELLTNADWEVLGARDLFFYLIANPEGLTKGAIGITFWPNLGLDQLSKRFKSTIYRLRQALGQASVLYQNDYYCFNNALDYEYDIEIFLEKLALAKQASHPSQRADYHREAIAIYKGHYLLDVDGSWIMPERERLWQAYAEAVLSLARYHFEAKEYQISLDYCWRALQKDSCFEEAHRLAMRAYAAMGNRSGVIRQHQWCRQAMADTFNVLPSPQTEKLFRDFTN